MAIKAIRSAIPQRRETASDIAAQTGGDVAFIRDKVGVAQRYILAPGETGVSLAAAACRRLFADTSLRPEMVELLVYVTQNPDRRLPQNSAMLAATLGLPVSLAAFDVSLGCSGYLYGLKICDAMLAALPADHAVLVTCDPYSRIIAAEDLATNAVFGDAATATWISREGDGARLGRIDFGTDGVAGEALRIDAGGAFLPLVSLGSEGVSVQDRDAHRLRMDGRAVFDFVMRRIPRSVSRCLELNGVGHDAIDAYALHQGSAFMLLSLARAAGIPREKLLMNLDRYGNTVSSTIPLLLETEFARRDTRLRTILMSGFGVGLSWATGILTTGSTV